MSFMVRVMKILEGHLVILRLSCHSDGGRKAICSSNLEGLPGIVLEFEMEKLE